MSQHLFSPSQHLENTPGTGSATLDSPRVATRPPADLYVMPARSLHVTLLCQHLIPHSSAAEEAAEVAAFTGARCFSYSYFASCST